MSNLCKIVKRVKDNKYEVHLFVDKLHLGVCNDIFNLIKSAKIALVNQINANKKDLNLREKSIKNALKELDCELGKLKLMCQK